MIQTGNKYKNVQCVAFEIRTGLSYGDYAAKNNDAVDYKLRLDLTKEIIDKAYNSVGIDSRDSTLKVFMLPEFFYRGKNGAYDLETTSKIVESLREMVKDPKYKNWLFVFGTIVGCSKVKNKNDKNFEAYNYSFVQKGNGGEKDSLIVMKESKSLVDYSDIDGNEIRLSDSNTMHLSNYKSYENRNENKKWNYDGNTIFEVDGIRFSLEICLDHLEGRVDNFTALKRPVQIQLVTSAGASLSANDSLDKNGHAFICDGTLLQKSKVQNKKGVKVSPVNKRTIEFYNNKDNKKSVLFKEDKGNLVIYKAFSLNKELTLDM